MTPASRIARVLLCVVAFGAIDGEGEVAAQMKAVRGPFAASGALLVAPSPRVAMDASGNFVVVWQDDVGGGNFDVFARRFDCKGVPTGAEIPVNKTTAGQQIDPSVAFLGDGSGDYAVVWTGQDSEAGGVRGNIFDASDTPAFAQDMLINTTQPGDQRTPSIAGTPTGFVATWEYYPIPGNNEIRARLIGSGGSPSGSEKSVVLDSHTVAVPHVDADPSGNFVVTWNMAVALGDSDVFARRFDNSASALAPGFLVNVAATAQQYGPRVQAGGGGKFLVAWNAGGTEFIPYFQQYDSVGKVDVERPAAEWPPAEQRPGSVDPALASDGTFATVYVQPGPEIAGLLFDSAGNVVDSDPADPTTNEFLVHDYTVDQTGGFMPRIATDGAGLYVVAYGNTGRSAGPMPHTSPHAAVRLFASGPTSCPSPTCGDPDGSGLTTASEAQLALRTAVGSGNCAPCLCDLDGSGMVKAGDAQAMLRAAVGLPATLSCPPCP